jgi:predicted XRE-type DNA-binding protein
VSIGHVTVPGENVFEDLGFAPEEAENLKIRSMLMIAIRNLVEDRGLKQTEAAELFGTTQPRVSDVMRGKIDEFTIDSLVNMLSRAGVRVELHLAQGRQA